MGLNLRVLDICVVVKSYRVFLVKFFRLWILGMNVVFLVSCVWIVGFEIVVNVIIS